MPELEHENLLTPDEARAWRDALLKRADKIEHGPKRRVDAELAKDHSKQDATDAAQVRAKAMRITEKYGLDRVSGC